MAENSILWTTGATGDGASEYTQAELVNFWMRKTMGIQANEGPLEGVDNELAVSGSASPLSVATGAAYVYGFPYENTAVVNPTVTTPVVGTTGFRVNLRANWTAQTVRVTVVESADGVPGIPALVQSAGTTWDVPLATGTITTGGVINLTDAREFIHFSTRVKQAMMDSDSVGTGQLGANAVTSPKIATDQIDSQHYVAGSIDLEHMAPDSIDSDQYVNGSIDLEHLAADSVDDTKLGNRVIQFRRRQGASATIWDVEGNTTYTPTTVRMQAGCKKWTGGAASSGNFTITFPEAFSAGPLVFITNVGDTSNRDVTCAVDATGGASVDVYWEDVGAGTHTALIFNWLAIGPE